MEPARRASSSASPRRGAVGKDPIEAFVARGPARAGHARSPRSSTAGSGPAWCPYRDARRRRDGGPRRGLCDADADEAGERAAVCIAVDVRALRQIETDLAASQAIFGQSPFGFLLFDTDLRLLRVNQRFATVFGRTADDHRGRTPARLPAPASRPTGSPPRCARCWRPATPSRTCTSSAPSPGSGERRHWSISLYRLHSGSGRPIGVAGLGHRRHRPPAPPSARPRTPAATSPCSTRPAPRIGNSLDLETTARELLDVAVPQLLRPGLRRPLPGRCWPATRTPAGHSPTAARELRRVAFASAVSDAPLATAGRCRHARRPGRGRRRPPLPLQLALRRRPAHRPARRRRRRRPGGPELGGLVQSTLAVPMVAHDTVARPRPVLPHQGQRAVRRAGPGARRGTRRARRRLHRQRPPLPARARTRPDPAAQPAAARRPGGRRPRHRLPLPAGQHGDRGRRRLVRRHRTARPPHRAGRRRRHGPRPARRRRHGRTAHRRAHPGPARPRTGRGALRARRDRPRPRRARRRSQQAARGRRPAPATAGPVRGLPRHLRLRRLRRRHPALHLRQRRAPAARPGRARRGRADARRAARACRSASAASPSRRSRSTCPDGALLALYTDGLVESRDHPLDEGLQAFRARARRTRTRPLEDVCDHVLSTARHRTTARTTSRC